MEKQSKKEIIESNIIYMKSLISLCKTEFELIETELMLLIRDIRDDEEFSFMTGYHYGRIQLYLNELKELMGKKVFE